MHYRVWGGHQGSRRENEDCYYVVEEVLISFTSGRSSNGTILKYFSDVIVQRYKQQQELKVSKVKVAYSLRKMAPFRGLYSIIINII